MDTRFIAGAAAVAVALTGCSGGEPPRSGPPGSLPPGTAEISLAGAGLGRTDDVSCSSTGSSSTINTGDETAGTTSSVDRSDGLTVQYAQMRNVEGFTGSYWANLGSEAEVAMTQSTFLITGTATGFEENNPRARTSKTFSIRVAC